MADFENEHFVDPKEVEELRNQGVAQAAVEEAVIYMDALLARDLRFEANERALSSWGKGNRMHRVSDEKRQAETEKLLNWHPRSSLD